MAKTIVTQFGEFLNYANIVKIGIITNWEDAEIDEKRILSKMSRLWRKCRCFPTCSVS